MRIIVVGGGVLGASTAFHLVSAGAEVVLVERAHEGRATSAGAGIICPWASRVQDPEYYRMSCAGARYYPELVARLQEAGEHDVSYGRVGALSVPGDPDELDRHEQRVRERARQAPEAGAISRLTPREARALFPPLREDWSALHVAGAARVDGRRLAAALQRAAVRRGVRLMEDEARLLTQRSRVTGVVTAGSGAVSADAVVVCAGAWAPALLGPLDVRLAVEPQRGQIVHLRLPGTDTKSWPVVLPFSDHYMLAFDDSRVVIGATRETGSGFDYRVTAGGMKEVLDQGLTLAPGLAAATIIETRIGFRPLSADRRPLLGRVPGMEGLVIGNGLGSNGLTMGPYAGRLLAETVLGQKPGLDLAPYDPLRI
jgi:D-amino-acid dehydrogenase